MMIPYTGFHGTTLHDCQTILRCQYFNWSNGPDNWLGRGAYFFSGSLYYAIWWAKDHKHYSPFAVLSADIRVEQNNILDVATPEGLEKLNKTAKHIVGNRDQKSKYASNPITDATVINYLFNHVWKFDVVIGIYDFTAYYRTEIQGYATRISGARQTQLCVRNLKCISNIQQVV
jgi:hypothetical protein